MSLAPSLLQRRSPLVFQDLLDFIAKQNDDSWGTIPLDVSEERGEYIIKADLPGVREDQIHISLMSRVLTIWVEQREENEQHIKFIVRERRSYTKQRSIVLNSLGQLNSLRAVFVDGVLTIHVKRYNIMP